MNKKFRNALLIVIGTSLLAIGTGLFILPYNILSGGCAGIAVAVAPLINVSTETIVNVLVLGLFFIGLILLGKDFALKTAASSFIYPFILALVMRLNLQIEIDPLLASIYGGLLVGAGIGVVIRGGASTGGMDIPALIANKYFGIKLSTCVLVVDALTVCLGFIYYGIPEILLGLVSVYASSLAVEKILGFGSNTAKSVQIISPKIREMSVDINKELDRGTTISLAEGGYTSDKREVLLTVVSNKQYQNLLDIINKYDKEAFVIVMNTLEVHGEGFSDLHSF